MSFAYGSDSSEANKDKRNIIALLVISALALLLLVWIIDFMVWNCIGT